jgi:large subunit ribosomal protein L22
MATKVEQANNHTLVRASARSLHISPRKMRLVTNLVKGLRASEAVSQLSFTNKKGAKYLSRLIQSAVANAENNFSLKADNLFVKSATCDMGQTMKRYFPRARGSAFVIRRKMTHVNVVLEEKAVAASKKPRFSLPKRVKKDQPIKTQEGSLGEPEAMTTSPETAKGVKVSEHKAKHQENTETTIREKTGDENQLKSN